MDGKRKKYYKWNKEDLQRALSALEKKEMSLNQISARYSISKPTILRHARKRNKFANNLTMHKGRPTTFNLELENMLVKHILDLEKNLFGLTISDVRKLAFDVAEKHNIPHKFNSIKKMAGKAWFYSFKARHPELSVRQPESTSMNRVKGFNKQNVQGFFDLLEKIVDENNLTAVNIFNVDECGFSTVQKKPQKVVGMKGKKQIGAVTSGERGVNTTAVCCASATGQFVTPMIIFKRMRQNPELANGAPEGSIVTISESGYINSTLFVEWIRHFINVVKPSPNNKVLLLLDGHTTHSKNLEALTLARDNGIIMLQLPGHTTHRLQPLDVSFFKPLSTYYIQAVEKWLRTNPGRQVTQYQVASLFAEAYGRAAVIGSISNGFRATGVWPINRNVFPEYLFEAADNMDADSSRTSNNESTSILEDSATILTSHDQDGSGLNQLEKSACEDIKEENVVSASSCHVQQPSTSGLNIRNTNKTLKNKSLIQSEINNCGSEDNINKKEEITATSLALTQQPSTSGLNSKNIRKSLNDLCPIPKNKQHKKSTIQKATELTSSPYKNKLEESVATKQKKITRSMKNLEGDKSKVLKKGNVQNNKKIVQKKKMTKSKKRQISSSTSSEDFSDVVLELTDDDDDDDKENYCAICDGHYFDKNGPNVDWIQCVRCKRWVHETCTSNPDICDNCFN